MAARSGFLAFWIGLVALMALDVTVLGHATRTPRHVTPGDAVSLGERVVLFGTVDRRADQVPRDRRDNRVRVKIDGRPGHAAWLVCNRENAPAGGPGTFEGTVTTISAADFTVDEDALPSPVVLRLLLGALAATALAFLLPPFFRGWGATWERVLQPPAFTAWFAALFVWAPVAGYVVLLRRFGIVESRMMSLGHLGALLPVCILGLPWVAAFDGEGLVYWRKLSLRTRRLNWGDISGIAFSNDGVRTIAVRSVTGDTVGLVEAAWGGFGPALEKRLVEARPNLGPSLVALEAAALRIAGAALPIAGIRTVSMDRRGLSVHDERGVTYLHASLIEQPARLATSLSAMFARPPALPVDWPPILVTNALLICVAAFATASTGGVDAHILLGACASGLVGVALARWRGWRFPRRGTDHLRHFAALAFISALAIVALGRGDRLLFVVALPAFFAFLPAGLGLSGCRACGGISQSKRLGSFKRPKSSNNALKDLRDAVEKLFAAATLEQVTAQLDPPRRVMWSWPLLGILHARCTRCKSEWVQAYANRGNAQVMLCERPLSAEPDGGKF